LSEEVDVASRAARQERAARLERTAQQALTTRRERARREHRHRRRTYNRRSLAIEHASAPDCPAFSRRYGTTASYPTGPMTIVAPSDDSPARDPSSSAAIRARGLVKRFGDVCAVDGIDLDVPRGMIFALLGPNGAGKTTLMRLLATLARPDAGSATVMGHDLVAAPHAVRSAIAMTGQFASLDEDLTGRENLVLLARLWGFRGRAAKDRADSLLAAFDLAAAAARQVRHYSGGMRRRLDIAASLLVTPGVLFLDEPTTGLDPGARQGVWRLIRALAEAGVTVLLTTQYLDEADQLAARIAVIDHGRKIAEGTSRELKAATGSGFLHIALADDDRIDEAARLLEHSLGGKAQRSAEGAALSIAAHSGGEANAAIGALLSAGIELTDFSMGRPSLEEVFFALTGRRDHDHPGAGTRP
jgi:ABC-2 type transport system ATP-binding protein